MKKKKRTDDALLSRITQPGARAVVEAYRSCDIVTDPEGSYTGNTLSTLQTGIPEEPKQDADDL